MELFHTTTIQVSTPGAYNQYGEATYTDYSIVGRLIKIDKLTTDVSGNTVLANAKLFTVSDLPLDSIIGEYQILTKKPCRDKAGIIQFYKYMLKVRR